MVHIVNTFGNANGGSEWHAVSLFEKMADEVDVTLWTESTIPPEFYGRYPIRRIEGSDFPKGGNIVFLGAYVGVGGWIRKASPDRVIVVYNIFEPSRLEKFRQAMRGVSGLPEVEVVFVSGFLRRLTPEATGPVFVSPIDLTRFTPRLDAGGGVFTIGKHSRDEPYKHNPEDLPMYRSLASKGVKVRLMGGACIEPPRHPLLEYFAAGTEPADEFLKTLDVFYFRNDPRLREAWGRSVMEAFATGIPVVAGRNGGYADVIRSGENGFLVDSAAEAEEVILHLRDDLKLRNRIGLAGLDTVRELYSPAESRRSIQFYSAPKMNSGHASTSA